MDTRWARSSARTGGCVLLVMMALLWCATVNAEEEEKATGWFNKSELNIVSTGGNSDATTLGFNNLLRHVWQRSEFQFELGIVFSRSRGDRYGVGALGEGNFTVQDPQYRTDTERYFGKAGYGKEINPRFFWFVNAEGERNVPANVEHRYTGTAGLGNTWVDKDTVTFSTAYGLNYTDENLTVEGSNDFGGFRLSYAYMNKLTSSTTFDSELTFDENFDDLGDHRSDFLNAVTVQMAEAIALRVSLRVLYRNQPALQEIKIYDIDPEASSSTELGTGLVENDKWDTSFATGLVMDF